MGSGAAAGKMLLVTNACWIFDYWEVSRSSNNVCVVNFKFRDVPGSTHMTIFLVLSLCENYNPHKTIKIQI